MKWNNKKFRCYSLYEDITDGKGLSYRFEKETGFLGALIYLLTGSRGDSSSYKYEHGKRVEWSTYRATEVLEKKGYF